jgi:hypothetical protein
MAGALLVPAFAQTNPSAPASPSATPSPTSPTTTPGTDLHERDSDFNMGWLGLVGLAGLLGMRRHSHHNEPRNIDNTGPGIR